MKKLLLASAALMALSTASFAADLPARAAPMAPVAVAPVFTWTGFYIGAVGTGGLFNVDRSDYWCETACDAPDQADFGGGIGLTVGGNIQFGSMVLGVEGDISWTNFENKHDVLDDDDGEVYIRHRTNWDYLATLRGRVGVAFDRSLVYVTGGVAWADHNSSSLYLYDDEEDDEGFRFNDTQLGFAVGAGVEHAFTNNLTFKAEYLYVGFPSEKTTYTDAHSEYSMTYRTDAQLGRIGLNYKF